MKFVAGWRDDAGARVRRRQLVAGGQVEVFG